MLKTVVCIALITASVSAMAGQNVVIPVEISDVKIAESTPVRWEQYVGLPADKLTSIISAAQSAGADCHEFPGQNLVCRYPGTGETRVGIDFSNPRFQEALNRL